MARAEGLDMMLHERELYGHITVTVTIARDWRCRIGLWLVRLAGWFCGFKVEENQEERS